MTRYISRELSGLKEAKTKPSDHRDDHRLMDSIISRRRVIVLCSDCDTFWYTGLIDSPGEGTNISRIAAIRAADKLYEHNKNVRYQKSHISRDEVVEQMYRDYQRGMSLSQVGEKYQETRQSVYDKFVRRNLPMREKKRLPTIEFNGASYTWNKTKKYYRRTDGSRGMLHHDIWRFHCGEIPEGHQVIHRDGDKSNNQIGNLLCMPIDEVARHYHPRQPVAEDRYCDYCGEPLQRKVYAGQGAVEGPAGFAARRYCNLICSGLAHRKKK